MSETQYPEIINAVAYGTQAVLDIAGALAIDIPAGALDVTGKLIEARKQAIAVGGYVRSVETWKEWRLVALWADRRWVADQSLYAHAEAKRAGLTVEEFRTTPTAVADIKAAEIAAKQARLDEVTAKYAAKAAELKLANEARIADEKAARQVLVAAQEARLAKIDGIEETAAVPVPVRVYSAQPVSAIGEWADGIDAARVTPIRQAAPPVIESAEVDYATPYTASVRSSVGVFFFEHQDNDKQLAKVIANLEEIVAWAKSLRAAKVS